MRGFSVTEASCLLLRLATTRQRREAVIQVQYWFWFASWIARCPEKAVCQADLRQDWWQIWKQVPVPCLTALILQRGETDAIGPKYVSDDVW